MIFVASDECIASMSKHLCVLPALLKDKRPACSWKDYQVAKPTVEQRDHLFAKKHDAVCIVCGKVSGNLLMIDFDQQAKAYESWKSKIPSNILSLLVIERSQSGGQHVIFRVDGLVAGNEKLAIDASGKVLIETRGEGGLFLCAPSPGYELEQNDWSRIPILSISECEILLHAARELNEKPIKNKVLNTTDATCNSGSRKPEYIVPTNNKRPGDIFNESPRGRELLREALLSAGWVHVFDKDDNEQWRRPNKETGTSASLALTMPFFNVFSSNASPFEVKSYNFFQAYAIIAHAGDFSAAAAAACDEGLQDVETVASLPEFLIDDKNKIVKACKKNIRKNVSKMPSHLFNVPGFIGEMMDYINSTSFIVQPAYSLGAALAMQSMLCSQHVRDQYNTRPNLNIVSIGRSCSGKERARQVIKEIFAALNKVQERMYKPMDYLMEDASSYQALVKKMSNNGGVVLQILDELGKTFPMYRNDKTTFLSGILTAMMKMYTSASTNYLPHEKAGASVTPIDFPHLVIYGTSTRDSILEAFSRDLLLDGFLGRLLIFEGDDSAKPCNYEGNVPIPQTLIDTANYWLSRREKKQMMPTQAIEADIVVYSTPKAKELFDNLLSKVVSLSDKASDIELSLRGRMLEQGRQLAINYAVSENPEMPVIDEVCAQWAIGLITHLVNRKLFFASDWIEDTDRGRNINKILRYIEDKGECTKTDLYNRFKGLGDKTFRNRIIFDLLENNKIVAIEKIVGKAKTTFYKIFDSEE